MLIAAKVEDRSIWLWRTLFDNWNCYTRGLPFVARKGLGQPHWFNEVSAVRHRDALLAMHGRSVAADEAIQGRHEVTLNVDHVTPVNVIRDMIIEQAAEWTEIDQLEAFLQTWYKLCVLTPAEHERLNSKAFHRNRLPADRLFDRYALAGIPLVGHNGT